METFDAFCPILFVSGRLSDTSSSATRGDRAQLASLAAKDPEFYAFLEKKDADLLHFRDGESNADEEGQGDYLISSGECMVPAGCRDGI